MQDEDYVYTHDRIFILNTVVSSVCVGALAVASVMLTWRLYKVKRAGKKWWSRQKRVVGFNSMQLVIQLVNATFYLAPNADYLAKYEECPWHLLPVNVFGFIRWTCWAAVSSCSELWIMRCWCPGRWAQTNIASCRTAWEPGGFPVWVSSVSVHPASLLRLLQLWSKQVF